LAADSQFLLADQDTLRAVGHAVRDLGWRFATLDLEGYRRGGFDGPLASG
jgi:hypothetical protein